MPEKGGIPVLLDVHVGILLQLHICGMIIMKKIITKREDKGADIV